MADKTDHSVRVAGLVVAAGRGERAGGGMPKQYRRLAGEAVVAHAAKALLAHPGVDGVAVVVAPEHDDFYRESCRHLPLLPPVRGGPARQDSVRHGLEALASREPDCVLVHDAARPFLPAAVIDRVLDGLVQAQAVLPVLPVVDALKRIGPDGAVAATVRRDGLARAQTPQGFRFPELLAGHRTLAGEALSDDIAIAERTGLAIAAVAGDDALFKITNPSDLARAVRHLASAYETRTGTGFDVHGFCAGEHVILCGVRIPHDRGLAGHSDADVGLHALTDAVLGAIAGGDIGQHFPPDDPRWRGAASEVFFAHAVDMVRRRGGALAHIDVTLVCQQPRVAPYRDAMRRRLSEIASLPVESVSVKATTTEGLGFTGRGEGIAALAAAGVRLPVGEA